MILIHGNMFKNHCHRYGVPIKNTWEEKVLLRYRKIWNIKIKMKSILTNKTKPKLNYVIQRTEYGLPEEKG